MFIKIVLGILLAASLCLNIGLYVANISYLDRLIETNQEFIQCIINCKEVAK